MITKQHMKTNSKINNITSIVFKVFHGAEVSNDNTMLISARSTELNWAVNKHIDYQSHPLTILTKYLQVMSHGPAMHSVSKPKLSRWENETATADHT